jgi:hypothetical protein
VGVGFGWCGHFGALAGAFEAFVGAGILLIAFIMSLKGLCPVLRLGFNFCFQQSYKSGNEHYRTL